MALPLPMINDVPGPNPIICCRMHVGHSYHMLAQKCAQTKKDRISAHLSSAIQVLQTMWREGIVASMKGILLPRRMHICRNIDAA
jgi:hypothetical protein